MFKIVRNAGIRTTIYPKRNAIRLALAMVPRVALPVFYDQTGPVKGCCYCDSGSM